ncbi:MAG: diguanylate cyclase [bacterium]
MEYFNKLRNKEIKNYSMRKRFVKENLEITWGKVTVNLIFDEEDEPQFLLGVVREINEQVEAERQSEKLSTIVTVQQEVSLSELNLEDTMQKVAESAKTVTEADGAVVELVEEGQLVYRSAVGTLESSIGLKLPLDESISGEAYTEQEMLVCHDAQTDNRVKEKDKAQDVGFRSGILVPLSYKNKTFGVLKVTSRKPYYFQEDDQSTMQLLSGLLSSQIYHSILFEDTLLQAKTDELTGLGNRRQLMEDLQTELERTNRYDHDLTVAFLDIDHFKLVNDTHGHVAGDKVLKELGGIIREETREVDIIGRYGGEEFIIATPEIASEGAQEVAERIRTQLAESRFQDDEGTEFKVTCSIGLAEYDDEETVNELIEKADDALYKAKKNGRNRIETHDREN